MIFYNYKTLFNNFAIQDNRTSDRIKHKETNTGIIS